MGAYKYWKCYSMWDGGGCTPLIPTFGRQAGRSLWVRGQGEQGPEQVGLHRETLSQTPTLTAPRKKNKIIQQTYILKNI